MLDTARCTPDQPWRLCIYSDAAKPGAQLKQRNYRELQSVYAGFLDFGAAWLAKGELWMTVATVQSSLDKKIKGGMSQLVGALVKIMLDTSSHHLERSGLLVFLSDCSPF